MKFPKKSAIILFLLAIALVPVRENPNDPPRISRKEYEEYVKSHNYVRNLHPFLNLPAEERMLLRARTGIGFSGRSLLGINVQFISYSGHNVASVPKTLVKDFKQIDGEAWISKKELPLLDDIFATRP